MSAILTKMHAYVDGVRTAGIVRTNAGTYYQYYPTCDKGKYFDTTADWMSAQFNANPKTTFHVVDTSDNIHKAPEGPHVVYVRRLYDAYGLPDTLKANGSHKNTKNRLFVEDADGTLRAVLFHRSTGKMATSTDVHNAEAELLTHFDPMPAKWLVVTSRGLERAFEYVAPDAPGRRPDVFVKFLSFNVKEGSDVFRSTKEEMTEELTGAGFRVIWLPSTGAFFRKTDISDSEYTMKVWDRWFKADALLYEDKTYAMHKSVAEWIAAQKKA